MLFSPLLLTRVIFIHSYGAGAFSVNEICGTTTLVGHVSL